MMGAVSFLWPVLLLSAASVGTGLVCLRLLTARSMNWPIWLQASVAYFAGQGVLGTTFLLLGLMGLFSPLFVLLVTTPGAFIACTGFVHGRHEWSATLQRAFVCWRRSSLGWRIVAPAAVLLYGFSATSITAWLVIDAPAFYMAIAKMVAGTERLTALPGYDNFSSVGLNSEMQFAALFSLGMDGTTPRVLPWLACGPTLALLYGIARVAGSGRRGALLLVVIALTSSALAAVLGTGKTDLLAVGPALSAVLVLLSNSEVRNSRWVLAGILSGFACVAKLTYVVGFLPGAMVLLAWRMLDARSSRGAAAILVFFASGLGAALFPHVLKNYVLLGTALSTPASGAHFGPDTTARIVMTYPFALTFGRYWGQHGNLSPLVLAFAPLLLLRRAQSERLGPIAVVGLAGLVSLGTWIVLFPSVITPRYFLVSLLLLSFPVAHMASRVSTRPGVLKWLIPVVTLVPIFTTPIQTNAISHAFTNVTDTVTYVASAQHPCTGSRPFEPTCAAHETINALATPHDRVLVLSYVRFWLRPDLMQSAGTDAEVSRFQMCDSRPCTAADFWNRYRATPFRFIAHDSSTHPLPEHALTSPPPGFYVRVLFMEGTTAAYEVIPVARSAGGE